MGDPVASSGNPATSTSIADQLSRAIAEQQNRKMPAVGVALPDGQSSYGSFLTWINDHTSVEAVKEVPIVGGVLKHFFALPRIFRFGIQGLTWADRKILGTGVDAVEAWTSTCKDPQGNGIPCRELDATLADSWAGHNQELINWMTRLGEVTGVTWVGGTALNTIVASQAAGYVKFSGMSGAQLKGLFQKYFFPLALMCYLFESKVLGSPEKFLQTFNVNGFMDEETRNDLRNFALVGELTLAWLYISAQYSHAANPLVPHVADPKNLVPYAPLSAWISRIVGAAYAVYYTITENSAFQEAADTRIYGKPPRESFGDFFNVSEWRTHVFSLAFAVSFFGSWAGTAKGWGIISGLSIKLNNALCRVEAGVAELFGHFGRMAFAPPTAAGDAWLARSARSLWEFFKAPLTGYGVQPLRVTAPDVRGWWQGGRNGAAAYRTAHPFAGTLRENLRRHIAEHFHLGQSGAFNRVLQKHPYVVDNRFTRQVAAWDQVAALRNSAVAAQAAADLSFHRPDVVTHAAEAKAAADTARAALPKMSGLSRAYYRVAAGLSQRVIGAGMGTFNVFRSPKKIGLVAQHSLVVASLGALGVLIMESSRGIPDDVADRVAARSLINILPNIPFRYGYPAAGVRVYVWDFYLGNMPTVGPMLNMMAQQNTYPTFKAPEYLSAMRRAVDAGEAARNFLYALQALAIADVRQPGNWQSLTDKEKVALMIVDAPATRGMLALLSAAARWKGSEPISPEEVDQFPDIMVRSGALTAPALASMRYNMERADPSQFLAALPGEVTRHITAAHTHQKAISDRKRELGIK